MTAELDALTAQVAQNTSVEASALALVNGLAEQIKAAAASNDSAALTSLTTQLQTSASSLASAVSANTPAQPAATTPAA